MKKIEQLLLKPLSKFPTLVQHFISLEGEGGTIGRSALYIRTGTCNLRCTFCDTKFSVEGKEEYDITEITSRKYIELLKNTYSRDQRRQITNLSITGGEPLLNLNYMDEIIKNTLIAFPFIKNIIFETNGTMLSVESNCNLLVDKLKEFDINFMLSISPKLVGTTSYSAIKSDEEILNIYRNIFKNYQNILSDKFDIQIKFIHSRNLLEWNEVLMDVIFNEFSNFHSNQILIMPFTPDEPLGKHKELWENSKHDAVQYSLRNFFRYSPRLHVDSNLD
ncbi:MAG: radical SAM protein [Sphaerochaeta sp.]|jgi:organic radical activating enzyme